MKTATTHVINALFILFALSLSICSGDLRNKPQGSKFPHARVFAKALGLPVACAVLSVAVKAYAPQAILDKPPVDEQKIDLRDTQKVDIDIYKDTYIRYLGYANEVGEALGPIAQAAIRPSYGVAFGYIMADTADKYHHAVVAEASNREVMKITIDTFTWQLFASVMLPGALIHEITMRAKVALDSEEETQSTTMRTWAPTVIGLLCIPLIIGPIDLAVTEALELTLRRLM